MNYFENNGYNILKLTDKEMEILKSIINDVLIFYNEYSMEHDEFHFACNLLDDL
ncbi:hypothetical protein FH112_04235 [Staphylococcus hominis]|uniref:hypothetical protein n=1 Tax=Staphylococcus hominis TaxID=1290 RepID=UPI001F595F52|nr:hypothetical protein [Staphylococcus hominis]MCI2890632.1 hypothetical protein [Staphylococcus hominis]